MIRSVAVVVCILSATVFLQLTVIGSFQESASQGKAFARYRGALATGTAPIAGTDEQGRPLDMGTSVAYLEIPKLDLSEVVAEGTSAGVLMTGPGHRRDTPLPGQVGTSILMGRHAGFGGPFSDIDRLTAGDALTVTTGQGRFEFAVIGVRLEGAAIPALAAGASRLTLVTSAGTSFVPNGVLRVDADLVGTPVVGETPALTTSSLPAAEREMHGDNGTLWVLAFWLQALTGLSVAAVWAWHRWGHAQAWVVFLPPLLLVGLAASGETVRLLPNLL